MSKVKTAVKSKIEIGLTTGTKIMVLAIIVSAISLVLNFAAVIIKNFSRF